jgi:hypothetical protein
MRGGEEGLAARRDSAGAGLAAVAGEQFGRGGGLREAGVAGEGQREGEQQGVAVHGRDSSAAMIRLPP